MSPGFHDNVPEVDYHADRNSLSFSGAKTLLDESPAIYRHRLDHPEHKDVFDFGSAAHAMVLGVGSELIVHDYDPDKVKSPKATTAWKDQQKEARASGAVLLLPDEHAQIAAMAAKLKQHRLAMRLLDAGRPEVSAYAPDDETGVMRRCRFDWLGGRVLTDYKTATDVNPRHLAGRYGAVKKWRYDRQADWYTRLARDLGHSADFFAFIFQMKEPPYLVTVVRLDEWQLYEAEQANREALRIYARCRETDTWPGYLDDDTAAVISLTDQTYTEERVA